MITSKTFSALAAVLLICLPGCLSNLATGPLFHQIENVDPQQSVIYLYYPYSSSATNSQHGLSINGVLVTRLDYGGYFSFVSSPGHVTFSLHFYEKSKYTLEIVAGHTYFLKVKGLWGLNGSNTYWLEEVSVSEALQEIRRCRLMELPKENACAGWKSGSAGCQRTPHS